MKFLGLILVCAWSITSVAAMSANDKSMMMMHEKMGKMHMSAAKCMKAGKSMSDCNDMMMKDCKMEKMGDDKCKQMMSDMEGAMSKMMGEGKMGEGKMEN